METTAFDKLKLDYQHTVNYIFHLSNIRFKLLGLLPVATGIAFAFTNSEASPITSLVIGMLGFFVTIGILFYDQRNTEIYNGLVKRAKTLENQMDLSKTAADVLTGGTFSNRSDRGRKFLGYISVWHDKALAIIYAAVVWVWIYVIFASALSLFQAHLIWHSIISLGIATLTAVLLYFHLLNLDKK